jgi:molecular chaperone GrpE
MMVNEKNGVRIPVKRNVDTSAETSSADESIRTAEENSEKTQNTGGDTCAEWRDTALRLKAEMINYRRRQERWALDEVQREKDHLLLGFTDVLDDMEQALTYLNPDSSMHQAVQIAYNNMKKLLVMENVEKIDALGVPFDPQWHDAVVMIDAPRSQREAMVVSEVVGNGYRVDNRLLKPARVVVSKRS